MLKLITVLVFALQFSFLLAQNEVSSFSEIQGKYALSDVMNRVKIISDNTSGTEEVLLLDTFPNFNGYPKHISGSSFEGGILVNMDSDPDFEIVYNISYMVYAWNIDGTDVTGWPKSLTQPAQGAPAFGDIDGDGQDEIVVTTILGTSSGIIYAFEKDGTPVTGFPVTHGYSTRTPVLADLDNDGALEIIVNKRLYPTGEEWVYKGDGTVYPGWPQTMNSVPASSAAVGDITGDNIPEIVMEAYSALYVWDKDGNLLTGFPFILPGNNVTSYSSPVLVDIDNDNIREIIFGTHENAGNYFGNVFILKNDGTVYPNWPKSTSQWIYSPPAVGYINGDNVLDIAVGDQVLSGVPSDYLYAWDVNGNALTGFPVGPLNAINNQVMIADIDNDGMQELVSDDNGAPLYHAYNHDGTIVSGWPVSLAGANTFFEMPALGDIDGNGTLDMLCASNEGFGSSAYVNVNLLDTGIPFVPENITIACFQYNERHNGIQGDVAATIPVELTSFTANVGKDIVQLSWSTASETNNQGFHVQRKTSSGEFYSIGFIPGNGTTTENHNYQYIDTNLDPGKYFYRLQQLDYDGSFQYSEIIDVQVISPVQFALEQNYPNPFNPTTNIQFTISSKQLVTLKLYDVLGNQVAELVNKEMEEGSYTIEFDAENLTSGIYFYQFKSVDFISTKKMTLLK